MEDDGLITTWEANMQYVVDSELKSAYEFGKGIKDLVAKPTLACIYVRDLIEHDPRVRQCVTAALVWGADIDIESAAFKEAAKALLS